MRTHFSSLRLRSIPLVLGLVSSLQAQEAPKVELPRPSPLMTFTQQVGLTEVGVSYSRPGVKGRHIFGKLLPRDVVWRTGANASTKLSFSTDVKFAGRPVPAGEYALFTIPGLTKWTVILYKDTTISGSTKYDQKQDLLRVEVDAVTLPEPVETMRIDLQNIRDESATLVIEWEETRVPVEIEVDVMSKVLPQIKAALASDIPQPAISYYRWAQFFLTHDKNLDQAERWVEKGLSEPSEVRWLLLHAKAKLLAKRGDNAGAKAAAEESSKLAVEKEGPNGAMARNNRELVAGLK